MHHHLSSESIKFSLHLRFAIAFLLNAALTFFQISYAWKTASVSLLSDGIHNLSDILGLLMAWGAQLLLHYTQVSKYYTYGLKKATILFAFSHALLLFLSVGFFIHEAVEMLAVHKPMDAIPVMVVALLSIAINGGTACLFLKFKESDINIKAAFLHLIIDALTSLGVLISAILIYYTQYSWVDAAMALLIGSFIMISSWKLLRASFRLILNAVPLGINPDEVAMYLKQMPGVVSIHALHIWAISTQEFALTAHIIMTEPELTSINHSRISEDLSKQFNLQNVTLQVESMQAACPQSLVDQLPN